MNTIKFIIYSLATGYLMIGGFAQGIFQFINEWLFLVRYHQPLGDIFVLYPSININMLMYATIFVIPTLLVILIANVSLKGE